MTTYTRAYTYWHTSGNVTLIAGSEGTGVRVQGVRVGPGLGGRRILRDGTAGDAGREDELTAIPDDLIVLGTHKWDRPTVAEACQLLPEHAAEIRAAAATIPGAR